LRGTLAAVAELRARLLLRRLRGKGGLAEGVALGVLFLLAVPLGLVFAAAIGAGSYRAARTGHGLRVDVALAAILFGLWQSWTALSLTLNDRDGLDLRRFLVYPVPPGRIYLLGVASGIAGDPIGLFWLILLCGVWGGAALARPGPWLALLAVALLLFAVATVFLVALLQELLSSVLRRRRLREVAIGLSFVAAGWAVAAASGGGPRSWREALPALKAVQWAAFPAALANAAAVRLYGGDLPGALPPLGALALATLATGLVAYRLALAAAREGGEGGEARGEARPGRGMWLGPLRGRFAALVEKEVKYIVRHPLARIYAVIVPGFAALVAWKVEPAIPREAGEVLRALPLFGFAVYTHLVLQIFWLNGLGWERGGARTFYLAPVGLADVLAAKNAALYAFSLGVFLAAGAASLAIGGRPPGWAVAGALALHAGLAPILYGLGNVVAVLNPRAAPFAVQRNGSLSWLSGLAGMAILSLACGAFSLPVLLALRLESPWLVPGAWTALGVAGLWAYRRTLPVAGRLMESRRDALLPVVCGDDA
jgi:ABC-2 type transport system permease protein